MSPIKWNDEEHALLDQVEADYKAGNTERAREFVGHLVMARAQALLDPARSGRAAQARAEVLKKYPRLGWNCSIYVPQRPCPVGLMSIKRGSAIVAFPQEQRDHGYLTVYYEGNVHDAANLRRFAERVQCAHGRMAQSYPTIAKAHIPEEQLIHVGTWLPATKSVEVRDMAYLSTWCDWNTFAPEHELSIATY